MQQYIPALEKSWFELHQHYHFSEPQKILNKLQGEINNSRKGIEKSLYDFLLNI